MDKHCSISFFRLLRVQILCALHPNQLSHKPKLLKWKYLFYILIALIALAFLGFFSYFIPEFIPSLLLTYNLALGTIFMLIRVYDVLFAKKEIDTFLCLPISNFKIVLSKITSFLIIILGFNYFISILPIINYAIFKANNDILYFSNILALMLLPMICALFSFSISCFIVIALNLAFLKSYHRSGYTNAFIILFIIIFSSSFSLFNNLKHPVINDFYTFIDNLLTDLTFFVYIILTVFGIFLSLFIFLTIFYHKLCLLFYNYHYKYHKYAYLENKVKTKPLFALIRKEITNYVKTPVYIFNTFSVQIMFLCFPFIVFLVSDIQIAIAPLLSEYKNLMGVILILIIGFICGMSSPCSVSISIEGKQIWLLQTLPINKKQILFSKYCVHLIFMCIPTFITSMITSIFYYIYINSSSYFLLIMFIPTLLVGLSGLMALTINLYCNNFSWTNKTMLIKNSKSNFIHFFFGLLFFGLCALFIYLFPTINFFFFLIPICLVQFFILLILIKKSKLFI